MKGYRLTWKGGKGPAPVDGSALRPDRLAPLTRDEVAAVKLRVGRDEATIADLFEVEPVDEGGPGGELLSIEGAPPMDRVGAGLRSGQLWVTGNVGDDLGASMSGGAIYVTGRAGHRVGGPDHDQPRGMAGGVIGIDGDAGDYVGFLMKRGLIAVTGSCGASPGYRMLAGTVVVGRGPVDHPGLEMRRGTVVCLDPEADMQLGPGFTSAGELGLDTMPAIQLMRRQVAGLFPKLSPGRRIRLWHGDRFELNRGEVLQWVC